MCMCICTAVLPDRGWNLPSLYLPVWSRKTKTQWLPLSVTSLLRVMPKMYEDERFEHVISRRPRLDRLFEGLRWFLSISVYKTWQVARNFEIFKRSMFMTFRSYYKWFVSVRYARNILEGTRGLQSCNILNVLFKKICG